MASISVFVDDAVLGRLPNVCAKTGAPANGRQRIDQTRGGLGAAWLLLLLGPIGWVVFLVVALDVASGGRSRSTCRCRRPPSSTSAGCARAGGPSSPARCSSSRAASSELEPLPVEAWLGFALVAGVAALALQLVLAFDRVGVRLDASHRWVTLSGVDARFVDAVHVQQDTTVRPRSGSGFLAVDVGLDEDEARRGHRGADARLDSSISSASCSMRHAVIELELGREHDLVGPDVLGAQVDDPHDASGAPRSRRGSWRCLSGAAASPSEQARHLDREEDARSRRGARRSRGCPAASQRGSSVTCAMRHAGQARTRADQRADVLEQHDRQLGDLRAAG